MLRLTKKADYGLMALKFIAEHSESVSLSAKDIAEAVFYLTEASQVTGEVLHVDGGAHLGRW